MVLWINLLLLVGIFFLAKKALQFKKQRDDAIHIAMQWWFFPGLKNSKDSLTEFMKKNPNHPKAEELKKLMASMEAAPELMWNETSISKLSKTLRDLDTRMIELTRT